MITFLPLESSHSDMARPRPPPPPVTMAHLKSSDLKVMVVEGRWILAVMDGDKSDLRWSIQDISCVGDEMVANRRLVDGMADNDDLSCH